MEAWSAAMAIPPSAEDCQVGLIQSGCNTLASTPSSSTSGCTSADDSFDFRHMPTGLTPADCQLLLNSDAKTEELENAIERLKELILDTEHCSDERKWVVRHLVELRLRLQERREADIDPQHPLNLSGGEIIRVTLGHHFKPQFVKPNSSGKVYCDHCAKVVWSILQAWYICQDCGFISHYKCIGEIIRVCAQVVASERPQYDLKICPEQGLHLQHYRCAECRIPISLDVSWNEARICDYNGKYYCPRCHWNSAMPTPARVVHNWDFEPKRVCQASAQLLRLTYKRPLLPLLSLNSRLFGLVHELSVVEKQRDQLILMKRYLVNCRIAVERHILSILGERIHMIEGSLTSDEPNTITGSVHLYSMQDLIETENGTLSKILNEFIKIFSNHIKNDCEICNGRGHLCELCNNVDILYPFDDGVHVCKECGAVFHKACATMKHYKCSRCERRKRRKEKPPKEYICDGKCSSDKCNCSLNLVHHAYTELASSHSQLQEINE